MCRFSDNTVYIPISETLPHCAVGCSVVCVYEISWSYLLVFRKLDTKFYSTFSERSNLISNIGVYVSKSLFYVLVLQQC